MTARSRTATSETEKTSRRLGNLKHWFRTWHKLPFNELEFSEGLIQLAENFIGMVTQRN